MTNTQRKNLTFAGHEQETDMKVIVTGTTGYVGEGVMHACLDDGRVEKVLSVSRHPLGYSHPKLEEYIVPDFMALQPGDPMLQGYDAVYFCAGISSVGISMDDYKVICGDVPVHFAEVVGQKENMIITYVSGMGTSDWNPQKWSRIKTRTEHAMMAMGFRGAYGFRVALMYPHERQQFRQEFQTATKKAYRISRFFGLANTITEVAQAMIALTENPIAKKYIGVHDVKRLSSSKE